MAQAKKPRPVGRPESKIRKRQIGFSLNEKRIKYIKAALLPIVEALNAGATIQAIQYTQPPTDGLKS